MSVWYDQQHLSSQSVTPDNPADSMRQEVCLCPYVLTKQACEVEWTWLTTELLRCSYAGTVKAMEAKTLPTLSPEYSPIMDIVLKTGNSRDLAKLNTRDSCAQRAAEWPSVYCWEYDSFL